MLISAKITHADLLAMPDDGKRREIVEGELFLSSMLPNFALPLADVFKSL
jgi:hypothetical protein